MQLRAMIITALIVGLSAVLAETCETGKSIFRLTPAVGHLSGEVSGPSTAERNKDAQPTLPAEDVVQTDTLRDERSVAERLLDVSLATKVESALFNQRGLHVYDFAIEAHSGVVKISGSVESPTEREQVSQIARRITGVRDIESDVTVHTEH